MGDLLYTGLTINGIHITILFLVIKIKYDCAYIVDKAASDFLKI